MRIAVVWLSLLALLLCGDAVAQKILIPEKIERATVTDDKGMVQWAEWKEEKCPNCEGAGKNKCLVCERFLDELTFCPDCKRTADRMATCRMCAGTGKLPDPLEKAPCPGCRGASFLLCTVCGGSGKSKSKDDKNWGDCAACRGEGAWKCGVCNGTRMVETAGLKPSLKDASVKDLQKALALTEQSLKELEAITPTGGDKARKEVKAMIKAFETSQSVHPALKRLGKPFEDYMGKIYAGRMWQGYAEKEAHTLETIKDQAEYYLKHQKRMMELVQKRAEANAKLAADQKAAEPKK